MPKLRWYMRANWLTLSRIGLALLLPLIFRVGDTNALLVSTLLLALMGLSDLLDGYFARRYGHASRAGELIDSTADGFARLTVFMIFLDAHLIPLWMVLVVFWRDLVSWILRFMDLAQGRSEVHKRFSGKVNGAVQSAAIAAIMLALLWAAGNGKPFAQTLVWSVMLGGALSAFWSMVDLLLSNRRTLHIFLKSDLKA